MQASRYDPAMVDATRVVGPALKGVPGAVARIRAPQPALLLAEQPTDLSAVRVQFVHTYPAPLLLAAARTSHGVVHNPAVAGDQHVPPGIAVDLLFDIGVAKSAQLVVLLHKPGAPGPLRRYRRLYALAYNLVPTTDSLGTPTGTWALRDRILWRADLKDWVGTAPMPWSTAG